MTLDKRNLGRILDTAVAAARLAGRHAMDQINDIKATIKNSSELVTAADVRCQQIIVNQVKANYPNHGFIAEEGEAGRLFKQPPVGDDQFWWVIDPIDGTNNFAHGLLAFGVSIAVMHWGEPVVGVIYDPATDSMYTAVKDGQAKVNDRKISAGDQDMNLLTSVGIDSHYDDGVPGWTCEIMQRSRFRNLGTSALQLAYVAKGGLVGTIINTPKLWDIAAGAIIVEAAGGLITDYQGNNIFPLDLNNYQGQKLPTVAANKKVHPQIISLINNE
jgi:myo-inositol-1(or 4)-monophosphatase